MIDSVYYRGRTPAKQIGGAGAYAAVGASLASTGESPVLVSGVGSVHRGMLEDWCRARLVIPSFFESSQYSPITRVTYDTEESREEDPEFGLAHFEACTPFPSHVRSGLSIGMCYVFHDTEPEFWSRFEEQLGRKAIRDVPLVWEIAANSCVPEALPKVLSVLPSIAVLSINWHELVSLGGGDPRAVVEDLLAVGADVVIHAGTRGALVLSTDVQNTDRSIATRVGIYPVEAKDVTGGGNTFTGALAQKLYEGADLVPATTFGAAAASVSVESHGAPFVDERNRRLVSERAGQIEVSAPMEVREALEFLAS